MVASSYDTCNHSEYGSPSPAFTSTSAATSRQSQSTEEDDDDEYDGATLVDGYDDDDDDDEKHLLPLPLPFPLPNSHPFRRGRRHAHALVLRAACSTLVLLLLVPALYGAYTLHLVCSGQVIPTPVYDDHAIAQSGWERPALSWPPLLPDNSSSSSSTATAGSGHTGIVKHTFISEAEEEEEKCHDDPDDPDHAHLLVLTPLKNAAPSLPAFFALLGSLTHPRENTSLAFLVDGGKSQDGDDGTARLVMDWVGVQEGKGEYRRIDVLAKSWGNMTSPTGDARHVNWIQAQRRKMMAKARTLLLTSTLRPDVTHILWLDADLAHAPPSLVADLLTYARAHACESESGADEPHGPEPGDAGEAGEAGQGAGRRRRCRTGADVITPNVVRRKRNGRVQGYDLNNWAETPASREMKAALPPGAVLHEGDRANPTYRWHLASHYVPPSAANNTSRQVTRTDSTTSVAPHNASLPNSVEEEEGLIDASDPGSNPTDLPTHAPATAPSALLTADLAGLQHDPASRPAIPEPDIRHAASSDLHDPRSPAYIGKTVALDGVGGVATLVRADVHRRGAVFPSWAEDHEVETEGFAVMAKRINAIIVGLPNYLVFHE